MGPRCHFRERYPWNRIGQNRHCHSSMIDINVHYFWYIVRTSNSCSLPHMFWPLSYLKYLGYIWVYKFQHFTNPRFPGNKAKYRDTTVDGWNPAPNDRWIIPLCLRVCSSQVVSRISAINSSTTIRIYSLHLFRENCRCVTNISGQACHSKASAVRNKVPINPASWEMPFLLLV